MIRIFFLAIAFCLSAASAAVTPWKAGSIVTVKEIRDSGIDSFFGIDTIDTHVLARMKGRSLPDNANMSHGLLRYLRLLYHDGNGQIVKGEMVCNQAIAADLVDIFRKLFDAQYAIGKMRLIDDYDADDELSMTHNNTSCFCYRPVAGSGRLSRHSLGMAVDINPLYNPHVKMRNGKRIVHPSAAARWADRTKNFKYKISKSDLCYRLLVEHGFRWGGNWRSSKDYQHFEK